MKQATTDFQQLIHTAAFYGIALNISADRATGGVEYIVQGITNPVRCTNKDDAMSEVSKRIQSIDQAEQCALQRAEAWQQDNEKQRLNVDAWNAIATELNAELPEGCSIPMPRREDPHGLSGYGTLTQCVADALANWRLVKRDSAARVRLQTAVEAEGSELIEAGREHQTEFRPEYWSEIVELWQPIQALPNLDGEQTIKRGRVFVERGERRDLAWQYFGVVVPLDRSDVERAFMELEQAANTVEQVAEKHSEEKDRLRAQLKL